MVSRDELLIRPTEPVGLVVEHREARPTIAAWPYHEVEAAGEIAAHILPKPLVIEPLGISDEWVVRREVIAKEIADHREREPAGRLATAYERELEIEFIEAVGAANVTEPRPIK